MSSVKYEFRYMPLIGKLSGESMLQQTEQAINEIAEIVNENTAQADIINTLAQDANNNSVEALEKANEALETSGRVYLKETLAVDLDNYCESQLIYVNNTASRNLPVAHKGFLEVKTNDDKTQATQVFVDDVDKIIYIRTGEVTAQPVGDVINYVASYGDWVEIPTIDLLNSLYLPLSGGTLTGVVNGVTPPNGDNSKKLATTAFVNAKAGNYLPLSGGTMTGQLQIDAGVPIELLTTGTNYRDIQTFSTDGNHRIGSIRMGKDSSNNCQVIIGASNTSNAAPSGITITRGTSGNSVITGITPPADDNSTKIATTAFVTAKAGNYLPLSGGTINGDLSFTGSSRKINFSNGKSLVVGFGNGVYVYGDTADKSSSFIVHTNENGNGFQINAGDGTTQHRMAGKPDGTLTWDGQPLLPVVGIVQAFAGRTTPQGWLLCDGSAVSRTNYAALYAVIGTTYGAGNGSTTFNLPNLTDKFIQGSATAGTVKSAGLPNITGGMFINAGRDSIENGAFKYTATVGGGGINNSNTGTGNVNFNASRCSSVYGNSTTVQPPALTMRYIIKY